MAKAPQLKRPLPLASPQAGGASKSGCSVAGRWVQVLLQVPGSQSHIPYLPAFGYLLGSFHPAEMKLKGNAAAISDMFFLDRSGMGKVLTLGEQVLKAPKQKAAIVMNSTGCRVTEP